MQPVNAPCLAVSLTAWRRECVAVNTGARADGEEHKDVGNSSRPCQHTAFRSQPSKLIERLIIPL